LGFGASGLGLVPRLRRCFASLSQPGGAGPNGPPRTAPQPLELARWVGVAWSASARGRTMQVGILSQGLRIAPPEAPVTGYAAHACPPPLVYYVHTCSQRRHAVGGLSCCSCCPQRIHPSRCALDRHGALACRQCRTLTHRWLAGGPRRYMFGKVEPPPHSLRALSATARQNLRKLPEAFEWSRSDCGAACEHSM
jgi:hypothetical protein